MDTSRSAGILLHPTSLPGPYGHWAWRMRGGKLTRPFAEELRETAELYGR